MRRRIGSPDAADFMSFSRHYAEMAAPGCHQEIAKKVHSEVADSFAQLSPIADAFKFRLPTRAQSAERPFVLLLGNHSAGKSTFVNHLLSGLDGVAPTDLQKSGVAPTDDGFSVIAGGEVDENRDGPSLVIR